MAATEDHKYCVLDFVCLFLLDWSWVRKRNREQGKTVVHVSECVLHSVGYESDIPHVPLLFSLLVILLYIYSCVNWYFRGWVGMGGWVGGSFFSVFFFVRTKKTKTFHWQRYALTVPWYTATSFESAWKEKNSALLQVMHIEGVGVGNKQMKATWRRTRKRERNCQLIFDDWMLLACWCVYATWYMHCSCVGL